VGKGCTDGDLHAKWGLSLIGMEEKRKSESYMLGAGSSMGNSYYWLPPSAKVHPVFLIRF
jgi:hypothetical protein